MKALFNICGKVNIKIAGLFAIYKEICVRHALSLCEVLKFYLLDSLRFPFI